MYLDYTNDAPNNAMHPTANGAALIIKGGSGRVTPGVMRLTCCCIRETMSCARDVVMV
jgi:hypothetical protein